MTDDGTNYLRQESVDRSQESVDRSQESEEKVRTHRIEDKRSSFILVFLTVNHKLQTVN